MYFRSLPQGQGSFRPIFTVLRMVVPAGGQQLVSVQLDVFAFCDVFVLSVSISLFIVGASSRFTFELVAQIKAMLSSY